MTSREDRAFPHRSRPRRPTMADVGSGRNHDQPLHGVFIADLSVTLPGPYCSQLLRRLGAEVVHVEPPAGDPLRVMAPASFASLAEGKDSVTADLKTERDREFVLSIAQEADVVIEGWRPGVADRLGVGFAAVAAHNPAVIYCSVSGYGQRGALAHRPGHDINYLAEAGAINLAAHDGLPVGDLAGGTTAALRVVAALRQAELSDRGTHLDVSITGALMDWVDAVGAAHEDAFFDVFRMPHYGTFATGDGGVLALGIAMEQRLWHNLVSALGRPEWSMVGRAERLAMCDEIEEYIADRVGSMTSAEVATLLGRTDTCWTMAHDPAVPSAVTGRLTGTHSTVPPLDRDGARYREWSGASDVG